MEKKLCKSDIFPLRPQFDLPFCNSGQILIRGGIQIHVCRTLVVVEVSTAKYFRLSVVINKDNIAKGR